MRVLIIGAGPSGLFLAHYLTVMKNKELLTVNTLDIVVVDPEPKLHCTYCVFEDEIDGTWAHDIFTQSVDKIYDTILVRDSRGVEIRKNSRYFLLNNQKLTHSLTMDGEIKIIKKRVLGIAPHSVELDDGTELDADYIIDCSGHFSSFQQYDIKDEDKSYQTFYGEVVTLPDGHNMDLNQMVLMDWSKSSDSTINNPNNHIPSFCYTLPLNNNDLFLEETIIASKTILSMDELRLRLEKRLERMFEGVLYDREFLEYDRIPMNTPIPRLNSNLIIPFGSAGGMVNPVSGYMVGNASIRAKELGDLILSKTHPQKIYDTMYNKIMNTVHHSIKLSASEMVSGFSQEELGNFFYSFFNTNNMKNLVYPIFFQSYSIMERLWAQLRMVFRIDLSMIFKIVIGFSHHLIKYAINSLKIHNTNNSKPNVYIIGGGVSGLSSACYLKKAGYNPIIIEKNDQLGGRMSVLESDDGNFIFDKGPSWFWMPDVWEEFFNDFGESIMGSLKKLNPQYRVYFDQGDKMIDVPNIDPDSDLSFAQYIVKELDTEDNSKLVLNIQKIINVSIKQYALMVEAMKKDVLDIFSFIDYKNVLSKISLTYFTTNQQSFIYSLIPDNKYIQMIMEWPVLFLGGIPSNIPSLFNLLNHSAINQGVYYPMDNSSISSISNNSNKSCGMHILTSRMVDIIDKLNIKYHLNSDVIGFGYDKQNNKINRVFTRNKTFNLGPEDIVIGAGDYQFMDQNMLNREYSEYDSEYWDQQVMGPSSMLFYIGLNFREEDDIVNTNSRLHHNILKDKIIHHTLFFDEDKDEHFDTVYKTHTIPQKPLFYINRVTENDRGVVENKKSKETMFILIPISGELEDTLEMRDGFYDYIMDHLMSEKYLGYDLREYVEFNRAYGIKDFEGDYHSFKGNAYGSANTLSQFAFFRPRMKSSKLNNLYYVGQLTYPGGGLPPCLLGGRIITDVIEKRNSWGYRLRTWITRGIVDAVNWTKILS